MKKFSIIIAALAMGSILVSACDNKKWKKRQDRKEWRDSMKLEHPDSIIKYREIRWTERKNKIDAKFDSMKIARDSIKSKDSINN
jgi:hypothetical protein